MARAVAEAALAASDHGAALAPLVLAAHAGLYVALRVVGAVVLVGYGLMILWHSRHSSAAASASQDQARRTRSGIAAYRLGLATNLANPKALVFFGALLASLLPPSPDAALRVEDRRSRLPGLQQAGDAEDGGIAGREAHAGKQLTLALHLAVGIVQ